MKKHIKKLSSLFLVFILLLACLPVSAANDATIVVSNVTGKKGDTVDVTVSLENNPGIVSAILKVSFDESSLTLVDVKDAGILGAETHSPARNSPYTLSWVNDLATTNFTANGTIVTLTFKISENAQKGANLPISITYDENNYDIFNKDVEPVHFNIKNGSVTVERPMGSVLLGDADRNGDVNMRDVILIRRYLAGLVGEGDIDLVASAVMDGSNLSMRDVLTVRKYAIGDIPSFPVEN